MVAKVNVSLPEDVLQELDRAARESHTTRSALLVEAISHLLAEKEEERKREKRRQAVERIIRFADEFGTWDGTAEILKWRDRH